LFLQLNFISAYKTSIILKDKALHAFFRRLRQRLKN